MEKTKKLTKKEMFAELRELAMNANNETLVNFIEHEIELLEKKANTKSDKPTKTQVENEGIKEKILTFLNEGNKSATELTKCFNNEYTVQRISALLRQLIENKKVNKKMVKGRAIFGLEEA